MTATGMTSYLFMRTPALGARLKSHTSEQAPPPSTRRPTPSAFGQGGGREGLKREPPGAPWVRRSLEPDARRTGLLPLAAARILRLRGRIRRGAPSSNWYAAP